MPSILVIQHVPSEGLGRIEASLVNAGLDVRTERAAQDNASLALNGSSGLIVLGGPMGVYEAEAYPFLRAELRLIEEAMRACIPVLGICLGSQLIASVLGAKVYAGEHLELGFAPVMRAASLESRDDVLFRETEGSFEALHWHGDIFELPSGAVHLAQSQQTENQAFRYGESTWGLLFHLEATVSQIEKMAAAFPDDVRKAGESPASLLGTARETEAAVARNAGKVFGAFAALTQKH
jgi:GMP synthase (glutamine-hydrolysing)